MYENPSKPVGLQPSFSADKYLSPFWDIYMLRQCRPQTKDYYKCQGMEGWLFYIGMYLNFNPIQTGDMWISILFPWITSQILIIITWIQWIVSQKHISKRCEFGLSLNCPHDYYYYLKTSDNLLYNTLGCWVTGTTNSLIKRLMFQVGTTFFHNLLQNSLHKSFQFIFLFFSNFTKIKIKNFECPKSIRNYEKNNPWNIRPLVDELFIPATQQPSILHWRLSDFM